MKIRRLKSCKRNLKFYEVHFGLRKPYQILIDGTFAQAALAGKILLKEQIPKFFGDCVIIVTSKCIIHETKSLGPHLKGAHQILSQFQIYGCTHKHPICAADCIIHLIGESNNNHLIIATQDRTLKEKLKKLPVPLLHITHQTMQFENPSTEVIAVTKSLERAKLLGNAPNIPSSSSGCKDQSHPGKRFKKRKNPNPLSVLKSKKRKVATLGKSGGQGIGTPAFSKTKKQAGKSKGKGFPSTKKTIAKMMEKISTQVQN